MRIHRLMIVPLLAAGVLVASPAQAGENHHPKPTKSCTPSASPTPTPTESSSVSDPDHLGVHDLEHAHSDSNGDDPVAHSRAVDLLAVQPSGDDSASDNHASRRDAQLASGHEHRASAG